MDWRNVLNLPDAVTVDEVITRHRCLAKKYHPDVGGDVEIMQEINAAKIAAINELTNPTPTIRLYEMMRQPKKPRKRRRRTWC
jgi:hypothetical protein